MAVFFSAHPLALCLSGREIFIDNLLVRIRLIIVMITWRPSKRSIEETLRGARNDMGCETTKGCSGCGEALDFRLLYLFLLKSAAHYGSLWKTDRTSGLTSRDTRLKTLS